MTEEIKWGILGCGRIARTFAESLQYVPDGKLTAVASKTPGKACEFARTFNVERYYEDYLDLVKDESLDVIYVATTHNYHYEHTLLCLENKKSVLCEKPFTVNSKQAEHLISVARQNKVFLMEAMWTRFLPCIVELSRLLSQNIIGDIGFLRADFGFSTKGRDVPKYYFDPNLAGGALLDLGVYPVSFSRFVFKKPPVNIKTFGYIDTSKVDIHAAYMFEYGYGKVAMMSSSYSVDMPHEAVICGTEGYIKVPDFFHPTQFSIHLHGKEEKVVRIPFESNGLNYQAREVNKCLREGKLESDIMTLDESLEIMKTLDALRAEWGLSYPME
ncbi:MAG TPA: Gfo/Idh/MocA family oxidoreductase [Acetivibrio sp.]|uniref:Gfo/Idh/MocA family protein n=1 Tax=Acetivibrio sp. TaxID=1872092 RepID=UPI002CEF1083|nr:Gfo/Idh/MocA family oxidoreductase [Acetivibrio sp.]HOM02348.1 Gfo/Idh/MocA family oxidoreductase [Acetivibrio sp.]